MAKSAVTDENLRLIYAEGHEPWLLDQIAAMKRRIMQFAFVLVLGAIWMTGYYLYLDGAAANGSNCVTLNGGATLEQVVREGLVPPGTEECGEAAVGGNSKFIKFGALFISILVLFWMMFSLAEGIRSFVKFLGYRSDIKDHRAFLEKYDRPNAPAAG